MASTTVDIGTLIARSPELHRGRPCIAGTGVSVQRIAGWYKLGLDPKEIAEEYGHLTLAQVYAALAYYHANRQEIETAIAEEEADFVQLEQDGKSPEPVMELQLQGERYERDLRAFEQRYGMDSDEFYRRFESGELGDAADYFEWAALYDLYHGLMEEAAQ